MEHNVSKTGSVSALRWGEIPILLGVLKRANFNHWTTYAKVKVALRLAVYRQSFRLGAKPLEDYDQNYCLQLNSCGHRSLCNILSERIGLSHE
jgi:hypothetical protein